MTYSDLCFSQSVDALIAGLASRAHQWKSWEILQLLELEALAQPASSKIQLKITTRWIELLIHGSTCATPLKTRMAWTDSPSRVLERLFSGLSGPASPHNCTPALSSAFPGPLYPLDASLNGDSQRAPFPRALHRAHDQLAKLERAQIQRVLIRDLRYRNNEGFLGIL